MLELLHHTKISPQNTLIIFDEVQAAPKVIESLKYFCEDASEYAVVAAGSLLGVSIHEGLSFSVGYRVNSAKATKFRIWATGILKEYIKKGFVLDDERLKQDETVFGKDYFRELLERENFATQADVKAFPEYDIFNRTQKIDSDFDKMIRKIEKSTS